MGSHARHSAEVADIFRRWRGGKFRDDSGLLSDGIVSVVPKLCLGMRPAKLCLANLNRGNESGIGREGSEAKQSFAETHSQAELGNDRKRGGNVIESPLTPQPPEEDPPMFKTIAVQILPAALAVVAAVVLPAAADQNAANDQNGNPCVKINCESGTIENLCDHPVNFAACHADSRNGCLLNIKSGAQIGAKESLPFVCKPGKLAQADGCFPPFVPVSFSTLQNGCIPNPENPEALAVAAIVPQAPQAAPVPQAPQAAPAPAPAAPEPEAAEEPQLTEAELQAQQQEAEAAMQKARNLALQAQEENTLSEESAAELRRLREEHGESGSFLNATGDLLHALSLIGAAYLVSQGQTQEAKSLLETILQVKGKINQHTQQRAEELLAQIAEIEAQQQQQQGSAEALAEQSMQALRGAPPPAGTPTENALLKCNAWPGQLSANATANTEGNETVFHENWKCEWLHTETHLHTAARMNDSKSALWLIANGAEVNAKDEEDLMPLHIAAIYNATETAALLLKNGAEVNAKQRNGWTPLHFAAANNATETAALLLKNGAEVNAKDEDGYTPLDEAILRGYSEMQSLLRAHGGKCNKECE